MSRFTLLALAAAVLLLAHAERASAQKDGTNYCEKTTCLTTGGYFDRPLSSPSHPSKIGTCSGACDGIICTTTSDIESCKDCCYKRTCDNIDGEGTEVCPCE